MYRLRSCEEAIKELQLCNYSRNLSKKYECIAMELTATIFHFNRSLGVLLPSSQPMCYQFYYRLLFIANSMTCL